MGGFSQVQGENGLGTIFVTGIDRYKDGGESLRAMPGCKFLSLRTGEVGKFGLPVVICPHFELD